uniref:Uncharacterized protein n=1 Tax=viral metagenome TaxID=1070528 RepID=A0A6M3L7T3_9ZZZZ
MKRDRRSDSVKDVQYRIRYCESFDRAELEELFSDIIGHTQKAVSKHEITAAFNNALDEWPV